LLVAEAGFKRALLSSNAVKDPRPNQRQGKKHRGGNRPDGRNRRQ
jgi:hypothetical protein